MKEIKANELNDTEIFVQDKNNIKELAQAIRIQSKIATVLLGMAIFTLGPVVVNEIGTIVYTKTLSLEVIPIVIFIGLLFLYIDQIRYIKSTKQFPPKNFKYGIMTNKYEVTKDNGEGTRLKIYYMDVEFKKAQTYIKKVQVSRGTYLGLKKGDCVIVVSFDGKSTCGIKASEY